MSQNYHHHHQGIFNFSDGFERSQQEQQHVAQQIRRDKLRIQGFEPPPPPPLIGIEEEDSSVVLPPVYETAGMLSEMFSFPSGGVNVASATELLENQISQSYRNSRPGAPPAGAAASAADWFLHRQGPVVGGGLVDSNKNQISGMNVDSAAAMHLFLMNPQQQRSPSPSSSHHHPPPPPASSTLHMLLPNPSSASTSNLHAFQAASGAGAFGQFTWVPNSGNESNPNGIPGVMEGQGLSLSLSSSLQQLEIAKAEEMRIGEGEMLFFGHGGGPSANSQHYQFKNFGGSGSGGGGGLSLHQLHGGVGPSYGAVNILRNSKYAKAAQELLEEFCSVGRGQFKKTKSGRQQQNKDNSNPSSNPSGGGATSGPGGGNSSSSSKDFPPLSASDRVEHQRRKVKLMSMLDEVDRRYHHYGEQMQMVVNSFDMVMGFGSAVPYTCLAQKAMSRHFRCLKDAISAELKRVCEALGEKDAGTSGVTKGETPRLRLLDQSLRQQRAFQQMGIMDQEAWRPQRGLPERSVNILRAWLFEHFLHPYPSDADKHLLARQTGLSRNQVSNWFINARVRLWKPMVEEMYQQESKDEDAEDERDHSSSSAAAGSSSNNAQTPTPRGTTASATTATTAITPPAGGKRSHEIDAPENDPSFIAFNRQCFSENQANMVTTYGAVSLQPPAAASNAVGPPHYPAMHEQDRSAGHRVESSTPLRFGVNAGDVSLTLGLRHAGNPPDKRPYFS